MLGDVKTVKTKLTTQERLSESTRWAEGDYRELGEAIDFSLCLLVEKYDRFRTPKTQNIR